MKLSTTASLFILAISVSAHAQLEQKKCVKKNAKATYRDLPCLIGIEHLGEAKGNKTAYEVSETKGVFLSPGVHTNCTLSMNVNEADQVALYVSNSNVSEYETASNGFSNEEVILGSTPLEIKGDKIILSALSDANSGYDAHDLKISKVGKIIKVSYKDSGLFGLTANRSCSIDVSKN